MQGTELKGILPRTDAKIDVLKEEVKSIQNSNGSFPSDRHEENPDITAMAMLCLYFTDGMTDNVMRSADYLTKSLKDGVVLNAWLSNVPDPKITAVVVRHLKRVYPGVPELKLGISFIEDNIDKDGRPILPTVYRAQHHLGAANDIVRALGSESSKYDDVVKFIFSQQQRDGSFDAPASSRDIKYKLTQLVGATRMENTSGVIVSFIEDLGYSSLHPQIRKAVEYITPRNYPPRQIPVLSQMILRQLPSPALQVVNAKIMGNPLKFLNELPHIYQIADTVLSYEPVGVDQKVHFLRQLVRLKGRLYSR